MLNNEKKWEKKTHTYAIFIGDRGAFRLDWQNEKYIFDDFVLLYEVNDGERFKYDKNHLPKDLISIRYNEKKSKGVVRDKESKEIPIKTLHLIWREQKSSEIDGIDMKNKDENLCCLTWHMIWYGTKIGEYWMRELSDIFFKNNNIESMQRIGILEDSESLFD